MKHSNITIERHQYARELTKVFYKGSRLPLPINQDYAPLYGNNPIRMARLLFLSRRRFIRYAVVTVEYINPVYHQLNRVYGGVVDSYKDLKEFIELRKKYHNASPIKVSVSIEMLGGY